MPKHLSDDLKLRAVQHYINTSNNYDKTSIIFDVPLLSICNGNKLSVVLLRHNITKF
jgi:hypothetical protein